jgi:tetratricopeptide (TPR) repeat protein
MGQLEDAVTFYRQAADIYVALGDIADEGLVRNNLADTFIKLKRYDDARQEILRAIECRGEPYVRPLTETEIKPMSDGEVKP